MKRKMLALAAAVLFPAGAANADVATHCATSDPVGVFACASFSVAFDNATGQITVRIQNTDIWAEDNGLNPPGHGYAISGFGILSPAVTGGSLASVVSDGALVEGTNPGGQWNFDTNIDGIFVTAGSDLSGINGGIWGCYGTAGNRRFRTCNAGGDTNVGHVVFTFNTDLAGTNSDASSAEIAFRAQGGAWSYRCPREGEPCGVTTTTPEPISMFLLGTGLLGVGGVNLRRRRRNQLDA